MQYTLARYAIYTLLYHSIVKYIYGALYMYGMSTTQNYKCFTCGEPIGFQNKDGKTEYVRNKYNKSVPKRFNLDGSEHVCGQKQEEPRQERAQNKTRRGNAGYWRWYWAYGPGKNRSRYSNRNYEDRRRTAEDQRQKWRENFSRTSSTISTTEALKRLELELSVLQETTEKRLQIIKTAYRKFALKFHPDRVQGEENKKVAAAKFIEITEAYEVLTK